MTTHNCDICSALLEKDSIQVSVGFSPRVELCDACALPIVDFLKDKKPLEDKLQKEGYTTPA